MTPEKLRIQREVMRVCNTYFLREFHFALKFEGSYKVLDYEVCYPDAKVTHVALRKEYDGSGRLSAEILVLMVRDKGRIAAPAVEKSVVVCRRLNDLTPIPDECGNLIGYVQPSADPFAYYVFDSRERPRATRSSSSETTSPAPVAKAAIEEPSCPCVVEGPTVHEMGTDAPSGTFAIEEQPDWFGFQDVAKAS